MPWSPVPKFPVIIGNLQADGYTHQVGIQNLRAEIIRVLGLTTDRTIGNTIKIMAELGYIKDTGRGAVFYICQGKPFAFPDKKKEIEAVDALLDNYVKSEVEK